MDLNEFRNRYEKINGLTKAMEPFATMAKALKTTSAFSLPESLLHAVKLRERIGILSGVDQYAQMILKQKQELGMSDLVSGIGMGLGARTAFGSNPFYENVGYMNIGHLKYMLPSFPEEIPEKEQIKVVNDVKSLIRGIYKKNELLYSVDPRKFEEIIAELLDYKGLKVELTAQTRDGGYDIMAISNFKGFPLKFLVECKRYGERKPVGVGIIRSFYHVIEAENANKGLIVTSSYFSSDAKREKDRKGAILDLAEHSDVIGWVSDYIMNPHQVG